MALVSDKSSLSVLKEHSRWPPPYSCSAALIALSLGGTAMLDLLILKLAQIGEATVEFLAYIDYRGTGY